MGYNQGGWTDEKFKVYSIIFIVVMVLVGLANWVGLIHIEGPPPQEQSAPRSSSTPRPSAGLFYGHSSH